MIGNIVKPPANPASKPYILIVEDDSTTLSVYKHILENIGGKFSLKYFSDARDALYFLEEKLKAGDAILAILLDLHMPHLDGWQFLDIIHEVKELSYSPPLIWLCSADSTSYTFKQILKQAYVDRFIQKPIDWSKLKEFSDKVSELTFKSNDRAPTKTQNGTQRTLLHLMKYSNRFSQYPKMKKKPSEQIILNVRSKKELDERISTCLNKYEDPIYQSFILMDFFHTLEEFIIKVKFSDDPKRTALIRILSDYLDIVDSLWVQKKLHRNQKSKSYFDRYCSEYELFEFRYLEKI